MIYKEAKFINLGRKGSKSVRSLEDINDSLIVIGNEYWTGGRTHIRTLRNVAKTNKEESEVADDYIKG